MYTSEDTGLLADSVRVVVVDESGTKWFGTSEGLSRYDGANWTNYTISQGLAHSSVLSLAIDDSGDETYLWIGTEGGINRATITGSGLESFMDFTKSDTDLPSNVIQTIIIDSQGLKWFGTDQGIALYNGNQWRTFSTSSSPPLAHNNITAIGHDSTGRRYIGTLGGGVSRLHSEGFDAITAASPYDAGWSGLDTDTIWSAIAYIVEDRKSNQWYGTQQGASFHDSTKTKWNWETYNSKDDELVDDLVNVVARDHEDRIWMGTAAGISVLKDTTWYSLFIGSESDSVAVHDIAFDTDNTTWFATDEGAAHFTGSVTDIDNEISNPVIAGRFSLRGNYPNPFNNTTVIRYELPEPAEVSIDVIDQTGRTVDTIVDGSRTSSGRYDVRWNARGLASGIFIIRLRARLDSGRELMDAHKVLLIR